MADIFLCHLDSVILIIYGYVEIKVFSFLFEKI